METININEILTMQNPEEYKKLNLHCTATKNTEQIDKEGLQALKGAHSNGPNGAELTEKVFFTQGLEDGYLLLSNKTFNVFRNALVHPENYGYIRYLTDKGIDIKEYTEEDLRDMKNKKDFVEGFWKSEEIKSLELSEDSTIDEALVRFGLKKFSEENSVEYDDSQKMYNMLLENKIGNYEFSPDILPDSLKKSFFSIIEQSMKNQSVYMLDLQENIDYLVNGKDEETKKQMAKYNMHTLSGKGIPVSKIHRIVGKDGCGISMFDVTMHLCQKYRELYPYNEFPSIVSSNGYKEDCWMEDFYSHYITKFNELPKGSAIEKKSGLEDCMQDDEIRIGTTQIATRTIKDVVFEKSEKNIEEKDI